VSTRKPTGTIRILRRLPETVKARTVSRFREDAPFPDEPEVNRRVAYLMRIEEALYTPASLVS